MSKEANVFYRPSVLIETPAVLKQIFFVVCRNMPLNV